jgi:ComF family protein
LSNFLSRILNKRLNLLQTLTHKQCVLCLTQSNKYLCDACFHSLPRLPREHCPSCLLPITPARVCGTCLRKPPAWTQAKAALRYTYPIDAMIQALKYRPDLTLAPVMADLLLTELWHESLPDYVIPVPIHPIRLQERGFNQALEISRHVCKKTGSILLSNVCSRTRETRSQTELSWRERHKNVQRTFACTMNFSGKHVAILDDVMTSGATLNELAKVVHRRGASKISIWVVARTYLDFAANPNPSLNR